MSEVANYVPKALRLAPKDAVLRGIQHRSTKVVVPSGGQGTRHGAGYNPSNNQLEFIFTDGEGVSLKDTCVKFQADFYTGTTYTSGNADASGAVVSAADFVERIEFYVGQTSVLSTTISRSRILTNMIMKNELSEDWFKHAGEALVGWNSYNLNGAGLGAQSGNNGSRVYMVPLWVLHPALLCEHLPVLGEQIRIVLTLAQPAACLSMRGNANSSYQLSNVELQVEHLQYEPDYKRSLMAQISSSQGFSIPMIDFDVQRQTFTGTDIAFTQRNQRSNCLSMVIYDAKTASGRADASTLGIHADPTLHADVGRLASNVKVFSGDRHFTKLNGISSQVELLAQLERVAGGLGKQDNGTFSYQEYTRAPSNAGVPCAPIMISLERTTIDDTDYTVSNRGLSAYDVGVDADIQVQLTLSSALNTSNDELYSALVYEKTLVMADGMISIDA